MNRLLIAQLFLAAVVYADDFKLRDGTEYKHVNILRVEPDGIMVETKAGIVKLFFADLPNDVQEKYHYDPKKAEAFRFRLDAARDAAAEELAGARQRQQQNSPTDARNRVAKSSTQRALAGLSLEAHEIGTADGTYNRWYIDSITYSRDFLRQKTLLVTVRDFSRSVPFVNIHVYFIAHPNERETPLFVYGHVVVPVELGGELEIRGTVDAPPLPANITNLGNFRLLHGSDIDGWIVVGESNGQTFQTRASRQRLLDLAQNDPQRLAEMAADYDSSRRLHRLTVPRF